MIKELTLAGLMTLVPPITIVTGPSETFVDVRSVECLALNLYHEARNQGSAGLLAVAAVVLNRVKDPNDAKFYPIRNRCQFSWWCDGKSDVPKQKKTYKRLLTIAEAIVYNKLPFIDITDGAVFYHADFVTPAWAKTKVKTVEIQDHIFYRWELETNVENEK